MPLMAEGKVLPYLDIPFQHASPRILRLMRRPAAAEDTLARIHRWRAQCPDLTLRSTFIVGFPGETDADFELLLAFLQEAQLDRVGCFPYSPVEGATANALDDPVPEEVKQSRWERFMETQQAISRDRLARKVGREIEVMVDRIEGRRVVGRSHADAPEIDGAVYLRGAKGLVPGTRCTARVNRSDDYDLHATVKAAVR
jgi:ribosomal protein S12 methylthiotransferase